jgi:D-arabinose 1-dehydrogenase-like Zn-dependent alcohol dehydrogenase
MADRLARYRQAAAPLPRRSRVWPLYGTGFENFGRNGQPIDEPLPSYGPDELLVRHDACGLCFSDIKVIRAGEKHPRISRDIKQDPVVLGHEVTLTVVGVGENLRAHYQIGDRFAVQAEINVKGVNLSYGYMLRGGLSQYAVIDQRVLGGDDGNYLVRVRPDAGYVESALSEPWACVIATYYLKYRTGLKPGGTTWIIGTPVTHSHSSAGRGEGYTISSGFDVASHPGRLLLTDVPPAFAGWLKARARELGVEVTEVKDVAAPLPPPSSGGGGDGGGVDDIVLLGANPDLIEAASPRLASFGILALIADTPLARKVNIDVGRIHYKRWLYVGGPGPDIARAYSDAPVRSALRPGGRAWFVGAGGPMGRMHVQYAIESDTGPQAILCTARSDRRLSFIESVYRPEAEAKGIALACASRVDATAYRRTVEEAGAAGFDNIVVLAADRDAIEEAAAYLAPGGVMNIFAGVAQGTLPVSLDLSDVYLKGSRFTGHSGSTIGDMQLTLRQVESGNLSPHRLLAAVSSLSAARDALQAVNDSTFPGKVVIFPQIKEMPLTALPDLKGTLPTVYAKLKDGREWTAEAEEEFLRLLLP